MITTEDPGTPSSGMSDIPVPMQCICAQFTSLLHTQEDEFHWEKNIIQSGLIEEWFHWISVDLSI